MDANRVILPPYEYQGEFLQHWPDLKERNYASGYIYSRILEGCTDPTEVVVRAVDRAILKLSRPQVSAWRIGVLNRLLHQINRDPVEAQKYAQFLIDRQQIPDAERKRMRIISNAFYANRVSA